MTGRARPEITGVAPAAKRLTSDKYEYHFWIQRVKLHLFCKYRKTVESPFKKELHIFMIESRDCDLCFKSSLSSHRCSACRTVQYCSTICQRKDLKFHKSVCETWAKDKNRKILDKKKQKDHWKSVFDKD